MAVRNRRRRVLVCENRSMKHIPIGLALAVVLAGQTVIVSRAQAPAGYTLIWSDEFATDGAPCGAWIGTRTTFYQRTAGK